MEINGHVQFIAATNGTSRSIQANAPAAIFPPAAMNMMSPANHVAATPATMMSPVNLFTPTPATMMSATNHVTLTPATMMSAANHVTPMSAANHISPAPATMMTTANHFAQTPATMVSPANHFTPMSATMMSPTNHVAQMPAIMMSTANNHVTLTSNAVISQANVLHNDGTTTATATMSSLSDNSEELGEILASSLSENGADFSFSAMSSDNNFESEVPVNFELPGSGSQTLPYTKEMLSVSEITPIYIKSKNRSNFAALLVERLFDAPTRLKSNVTGRGKERLDPQIMQYVKAKAFSFYECNPSEINGEWKKCIKSIDDKSRGLKRKISANSVAATI